MADTKISALTALAGSAVAQTADYLLIVDASVTTDKKILVSELSLAQNVNGTVQATTSGTSFDFTIPAWATRVTLMGAGISTSGTSGLLAQIGDGGGIENTGYLGANVTQAGTVGAFSSGFLLTNGNAAANVVEFVLELTLENAAAFTWMGQSMAATSQATTFVHSAVGRKSTSAAMTTVRLTTVNGTDTFDAGAVNVLYS